VIRLREDKKMLVKRKKKKKAKKYQSKMHNCVKF